MSSPHYVFDMLLVLSSELNFVTYLQGCALLLCLLTVSGRVDVLQEGGGEAGQGRAEGEEDGDDQEHWHRICLIQKIAERSESLQGSQLEILWTVQVRSRSERRNESTENKKQESKNW